MTINFLERAYAQLEQLGLVSSRREFCEQWLGRQEGYIRTLRFYRLQPSVYVLAVLASRLDHYAKHFQESDACVQSQLVALKEDCWRDIEQRGRLRWIRTEADRSRERRQSQHLKSAYAESTNG